MLPSLGTARWWCASFQHWQSECVAVRSIVVVSSWLRERGSPESTPVHRAHADPGRSSRGPVYTAGAERRPRVRPLAPLALALLSHRGVVFALVSVYGRREGSQPAMQEARWSSTRQHHDNRHSIKTSTRGVSRP